MNDQQNQSQEYPSTSNTGYPPSQQLPPNMGYPPSQQLPPNMGYPPSQQLPTQRYQFHFSEKQMRRYFNPSPLRPLQCLIGGIVLLFISPVFLLFFILPVLAGITLILVGSIWLIIKYTVRPSDEQYRGWLEERQLFLVNKAHQKAFLDLTQLESPRFVFKGSIRPNTLEAKNYKEVYKKDTRFGPHFSINTHLIIFLTKDNIIVFSSGINALDQMWSTTPSVITIMSMSRESR